jgi:DNA-binding transcriptional MocR family regulator
MPAMNRPPAASWQKILDALAQAIASGRLRPGQPVPSHREAAREWGVATATVTRAYAEAIRQGLLAARVGNGTVVAAPRTLHEPAQALGTDVHNLAVNAAAAPARLNAAALLRDAFERLAGGAGHALFARADQVSEEPRQLAAAAAWLESLGAPCAQAQVFAAPGSQAALLVTLRALAAHGGAIACEPRVNPGLIAAADFVGARLVPVEVDAEGLRPERLRAAIEAHGVRAVHASPTCSNPLALRWSAARRREIAQIAQQHGLWLIEDDDALPLETEPLPLCALAPQRTVLLAGVSKLAGFALRSGFARVPDALADAWRRHLRAAVWMASPIPLEILAHWQQAGLLAELAAARRAELAERQGLAQAALGRHGYRAPPTGPHGWLPLAAPWDGERFAFHAQRRGVAIATEAEFLPGPRDAHASGVRLSLAAARSTQALRTALAALARLLDDGPPR